MTHATEISVDWGETDAGGLIYYPRFFHFVIVGLNDYFRSAADGEYPMEAYRKAGYLLPAVEASASFHSPLRAGDEVVLETTVVDSGTSSLTVAFTIARVETDEHAARGRSRSSLSTRGSKQRHCPRSSTTAFGIAAMPEPTDESAECDPNDSIDGSLKLIH